MILIFTESHRSIFMWVDSISRTNDKQFNSLTFACLWLWNTCLHRHLNLKRTHWRYFLTFNFNITDLAFWKFYPKDLPEMANFFHFLSLTTCNFRENTIVNMVFIDHRETSYILVLSCQNSYSSKGSILSSGWKNPLETRCRW